MSMCIKWMIKDGSKFTFVNSKWRCSMVKCRFGLIINRDWKVPNKGTSWLLYLTSFARWLDHKRTLTSDILELHPCVNLQLPTSWLSFWICNLHGKKQQYSPAYESASEDVSELCCIREGNEDSVFNSLTAFLALLYILLVFVIVYISSSLMT